MDYRSLGRSGTKVSELSLGGWMTFGRSILAIVAGPLMISLIVRSLGLTLVNAVADLTSTPQPQPERYTERQDVLNLVDEAINDVLTELQRAALIAHAIDGVPIEEIARRMGTNRNALYKLIHDARMKLKKHLEDQGVTMDDLADLFEAA